MGGRDQISELKTELNFLYHVAGSVHSLEIDELLQEIVEVAAKITKSDSCFIYLSTNKNQKLVLRASQNPHTDLLKKIKLKLGEGITGWVAREKKPAAISQNAHTDPRFKFFQSLPEDRFEAFLSVPILNKRGVVGVINVQHKDRHEHTPTEINLLSAIGKLVGGAIENALLVEETLELKEALEIRKVIEKAKGVLMQKNKLTETEAYKILQQESMRTRKSFKKIAEAILIAQDLKIGLDR